MLQVPPLPLAASPKKPWTQLCPVSRCPWLFHLSQAMLTSHTCTLPCHCPLRVTEPATQICTLLLRLQSESVARTDGAKAGGSQVKGFAACLWGTSVQKPHLLQTSHIPLPVVSSSSAFLIPPFSCFSSFISHTSHYNKLGFGLGLQVPATQLCLSRLGQLYVFTKANVSSLFASTHLCLYLLSLAPGSFLCAASQSHTS